MTSHINHEILFLNQGVGGWVEKQRRKYSLRKARLWKKRQTLDPNHLVSWRKHLLLEEYPHFIIPMQYDCFWWTPTFQSCAKNTKVSSSLKDYMYWLLIFFKKPRSKNSAEGIKMINIGSLPLQMCFLVFLGAGKWVLEIRDFFSLRIFSKGNNLVESQEEKYSYPIVKSSAKWGGWYMNK